MTEPEKWIAIQIDWFSARKMGMNDTRKKKKNRVTKQKFLRVDIT